MINQENYFLIDTVTATKIDRSLLNLPFLFNHCKVTEENIYELRDSDNIDLLSRFIWKTNTEILSVLPAVWAKIENDDKIFNLYHNKGNGDIMMLAALLYDREQSKSKLIVDNWVIVTDDKGLANTASKLAFNVIGSEEFIRFLKSK